MLNYATNPFVINDWSQPVNAGDVGSLSNTVTAIQRDLRNLKSMISFDSKTVLADNLKSYSAGGNISVLSPMVLSNSATLTINGQQVIGGGGSVGSNLYVSTLGAGSLVVDGDITYGGNLIHTSDRRVKEDIRPLELDSARVLAGLNPVRFRWLEGGREDIGLVAQEVAEVCPECVSVGPGGVLGVDYAKLVVVLLKILKEKL